MMRPRLSRGAKTAERVPITTGASPRRARFHSSYRSPVRSELWSTATCLPKWAAKIRSSWGVRTISGTNTRAVRPRARVSWIRRM